MTELLKPRPEVEELRVYDPGKVDAAINLLANENPNDMPPQIKAEILEEAKKLPFNRYPDPAAVELRQALARYYGVTAENIAVGNGADELIQELLLAYGGPGRTAVTFEPTFMMYAVLAALTGTAIVKIPREDDFSLPADAVQRAKKSQLIFICSPNNPTGNLVSADEVKAFLDTGALVVVDEAYEEFSGSSVAGHLRDYPNLIILRTFSKAFSLAGLRVGYLLGSKEVVENLQKVKLPYNVNAFSQSAAVKLLMRRKELQIVVDQLIAQRGRLYRELEAMEGYRPYPSAANFILVKTERPGREVWQKLLDNGILVRDFSGHPLLENCLRITIGTEEQNQALLDVLKES